MEQILRERGFHDKKLQLHAQCPEFKCSPGANSCCVRRILYCQPDFAAEKSHLEHFCETRGFSVIFLPKFHCELNFIEQVWGAAKWTYRMYENSTMEDVLINNVRMALDSVSLSTMRHFARRAWKFIDAYRKGLNGVQAAWAAKRYRGHRMLPDWILAEFDKCMEAKGCT
ncbi:hypothetical protein EV368DRAFT_73097 [Lentinula lateritia]|nr:hypothetical protein EV368DRAFT_73097 [Lentinula lateritia]